MNKPVYLFVSSFFPTPKSWRGGFCHDMAQALKREGHYDIRVLVPGEGEDYDVGDLHVTRFPIWSLPCGAFPFFMAGHNVRSFLSTLKRIGVNLADVAICHCHNDAYYANAVKKRNPKCLTLLHHHCLGSLMMGLRLGRYGVVPIYSDVLYLWKRKEHMKIDCHVFCSNKALATYDRYFKRRPEESWQDVRRRLLFGRGLPRPAIRRSVVFYNGYNENLFSASPISHMGFVIGCVANFQPYKDIKTLIEAFRSFHAHVPKARLRLVGSGETKNECERYVLLNALTDFVSFEKERRHNELLTFFNEIDLFVLPSRLEGFGCVYMEAWGCGVPFIACKGVGCEEVLTSESARKCLVPPMDAEALARRIFDFYKERPCLSLNRPMTYSALAKEFIAAMSILKMESCK